MNIFSREEESIIKENNEHARKIKKEIAKQLTDINLFPPENYPVSVFMAGSPGAGKTEASKWLIKQLSGNNEKQILRIDPDELRNYFSNYKGENSNLFQSAVSILVEKIHDEALRNEQSFVFDGTFSQIDVCRKNIERSLSKKRLIKILYVYQDPLQAWNFVQERFKKEGRYVPKNIFIEQYFNARKVVNQIKKEYPQVEIYLLVKNIDGSNQKFKENISNIDSFIKEMYTQNILENMLS